MLKFRVDIFTLIIFSSLDNLEDNSRISLDVYSILMELYWILQIFIMFSYYYIFFLYHNQKILLSMRVSQFIYVISPLNINSSVKLFVSNFGCTSRTCYADFFFILLNQLLIEWTSDILDMFLFLWQPESR